MISYVPRSSVGSFDSIVNSITAGKQVDRLVHESSVLSDVKNTFFNGDPSQLSSQIKKYTDMFGITSEDLKNLSVAALIGQMMGLTTDVNILGNLQSMMGMANKAGVSTQNAGKVVAALNANAKA